MIQDKAVQHSGFDVLERDPLQPGGRTVRNYFLSREEIGRSVRYRRWWRRTALHKPGYVHDHPSIKTMSLLLALLHAEDQWLLLPTSLQGKWWSRQGTVKFILGIRLLKESELNRLLPILAVFLYLLCPTKGYLFDKVIIVLAVDDADSPSSVVTAMHGGKAQLLERRRPLDGL